MDPTIFSSEENSRGHLSVSSNQAQAVIDQFRQWLLVASRDYVNKVKHELKTAEWKQREERQMRLKQEEEMADVNRKLKI